jgi:hypothetical protein
MPAKMLSKTMKNNNKTSNLIALALIAVILELLLCGETFIGMLLAFMAMLSWLEKKRRED